MPYQVLVLKRAEQDLHDFADWIAQHSPANAAKWFDGFVRALLTLETFPLRCGRAPEDEESPHELRQLVFRPSSGRMFRAVFTISGEDVRILRIRCTGQNLLTEDDVIGE